MGLHQDLGRRFLRFRMKRLWAASLKFRIWAQGLLRLRSFLPSVWNLGAHKMSGFGVSYKI